MSERLSDTTVLILFDLTIFYLNIKRIQKLIKLLEKYKYYLETFLPSAGVGPVLHEILIFRKF